MFKKLKERIAECESRLDNYRATQVSHSAKINEAYSAICKLMLNSVYGYRPVVNAKSNADILLECLCDWKEKSGGAPAHIWINGVKTDHSILKDTNALFNVYISLRKSFGGNSLRILGYTVDKDNVYFEVEAVTGDTYD